MDNPFTRYIPALIILTLAVILGVIIGESTTPHMGTLVSGDLAASGGSIAAKPGAEPRGPALPVSGL